MISFDEARRIVFSHVKELPSEMVDLAHANGRFLAQEVVADRDMPPRDLSAMDGYACRKQDLDGELTVVETIAAGSTPARTVGPGECSQIMTGAPVPDGADIVVMVEHTECKEERVEVTKSGGKDNIRRQAEEIAKGAQVLSKGVLITPTEVAVLATFGCDPVSVAVRPKVGVIATGDELVEPSAKPLPHQIRNSNAFQLCSQIERAGCRPTYYGIVKDTPEATEKGLSEALAGSDVVLLSGGVSMGEFDFVPSVLKKAGIKLLFEKIAIQPGKPTVFGIGERARVFGMPGNPVSTYVLFEMLVRPFLCRMMGGEHVPRRVRARLGETMKRRKTDRMSFRPAVLGADGSVVPASYRGSAHIHAYVEANAMVAFPLGVERIGEGEDIEVIVLE